MARKQTRKAPTVGPSRATAEPEQVGQHTAVTFPIVGIGASAGGLEAFTALLQHLPTDTGLAFVLVQHLDPQHESSLVQILGRVTSLPVCEITPKLRVEPDHVYVIPPNTQLGIKGGVLTLEPRPARSGAARSIDRFFEALAVDQREHAIGVVLSGTGSDGTQGLESIKAEGGITFAQDDTAKYDSMPRYAVASGCVDLVLSPPDIAMELARIARHPYLKTPLPGPAAVAQENAAEALPSASDGPDTAAQEGRAETAAEEEDHDPQAGFREILVLLRKHAGIDFTLYKSSTIQRRIARRMVLNRHGTLREYARFLRGNARELDALYSDMLINVTSFFRSPETFDFLSSTIFPTLLQRPGDDTLRVWVLGCSTGQEAYSIAMAYTEAADRFPRPRELQIFATDLNETMLEKARQGLYSRSLEEDVSPERLSRFFTEEQGGFRISKLLRDRVVFARQNLISDPPFSRIDLISCRNVLIYLEPSLQKRVIPTFHYSLKPEGFLFLGANESISGFSDLFEPVDRRHKIYARKPAPLTVLSLPMRAQADEHGVHAREPAQPPPARGRVASGHANEAFQSELTALREADRLTVQRFAPPGVLINAALQILQFRGPTSDYLEPPVGKATFDVLKMAREGLMLPLRTAINKAKSEDQVARAENVPVRQNGGTRAVNVEVIPLKNLRERCFLVLFENAPTTGAGARTVSAGPSDYPAREHPDAATETSARLADLERELAETRDFLQAIQEQHDASNEELQTSNEEVQSANEELQSVNEELETSKEELESANEELTTVNDEMAHRNAELHRLNSDLINLQASVQLSIVLVGRDRTVRGFSPQAEQQLNLTVSDIGRPIGSIRHGLVLAPSVEAAPLTLESFVVEVITRVRAIEHDVRDANGRWFSLRLRPYFTLDGKVDGAVLVLVDVDALKRSEQALKIKEEVLREAHVALQAHAEELGRFNNVAVGRELRMIDLKKEINALCERLSEAARYSVEQPGAPDEGES